MSKQKQSGSSNNQQIEHNFVDYEEDELSEKQIQRHDKDADQYEYNEEDYPEHTDFDQENRNLDEGLGQKPSKVRSEGGNQQILQKNKDYNFTENLHYTSRSFSSSVAKTPFSEFAYYIADGFNREGGKIELNEQDKINLAILNDQLSPLLYKDLNIIREYVKDSLEEADLLRKQDMLIILEILNNPLIPLSVGRKSGKQNDKLQEIEKRLLRGVLDQILDTLKIDENLNYQDAIKMIMTNDNILVQDYYNNIKTAYDLNTTIKQTKDQLLGLKGKLKSLVQDIQKIKRDFKTSLLTATENGNSFIDKVARILNENLPKISIEQLKEISAQLIAIEKDYKFLEKKQEKLQIKPSNPIHTAISNGGNYLIVSFGRVRAEEGVIQQKENQKKDVKTEAKADIVFNMKQIVSDSNAINSIISAVEFKEKSVTNKQAFIQLLERTGMILSNKKEEEFEKHTKNINYKPSYQNCNKLFEQMGLNNIVQIAKNPQDKANILSFSKAVRQAIWSGQVSDNLFEVFDKIQQQTIDKFRYVQKGHNKYLKYLEDKRNAPKDNPIIPTQEMIKFIQSLEKMNESHSEAILLNALRSDNSNMKNELVAFLENNKDLKGVDKIEFSMLSRYDACANCEFTVNDINRLISELSETSSQSSETSFVSVNQYDKTKPNTTFNLLQKYDGEYIKPLNIENDDRIGIRRVQSAITLFGSGENHNYVLKSGENENKKNSIQKIITDSIIEKVRKSLNQNDKSFLASYAKFIKCNDEIDKWQSVNISGDRLKEFTKTYDSLAKLCEIDKLNVQIAEQEVDKNYLQEMYKNLLKNDKVQEKYIYFLEGPMEILKQHSKDSKIIEEFVKNYLDKDLYPTALQKLADLINNTGNQQQNNPHKF